MRTRTSSRWAVALAVLAGGAAASGQTISNFANFNNTQSPFSNNPPQTTAGVVFTAPAGPIAITDFAFKLVPGSGTTGASAHLYRWDGARATGPSLFDSGSFDIPGTSFTFETRQFQTGPVELVGGASYIAFITRSKYSSSWGGLFPGAVFGGNPAIQAQFNFFGNVGDFGALLNPAQSWAPVSGWKLAFEANFIPAPGAAGLAGLGLLMAARRRR